MKMRLTNEQRIEIIPMADREATAWLHKTLTESMEQAPTSLQAYAYVPVYACNDVSATILQA